MPTERKTKYQILESSGAWVACKKAKVQPSGWLHCELHDGTIALVRPSKWREKPEKNSKT